jgi:hypothetical protein|nr:MAG TPA: Pyocin activator protein PrtN [Caudoviricetes sp.]
MIIGEKLYSPQEASEMLGGVISPRTLKERASAGKYPHLGGRKAGGGRIAFAHSHLQAIANALEHIPTPRGTKPKPKNIATESLNNAFDNLRQTPRSKTHHKKEKA